MGLTLPHFFDLIKLTKRNILEPKPDICYFALIFLQKIGLMLFFRILSTEI